jgi:hypothetical protein
MRSECSDVGQYQRHRDAGPRFDLRSLQLRRRFGISRSRLNSGLPEIDILGVLRLEGRASAYRSAAVRRLNA